MNTYNINSASFKKQPAANYQSQQVLPKRYQSPSQGPSHYFLGQAKPTTKLADNTSKPATAAASQSVLQMQSQSTQPNNLSLSSSTSTQPHLYMSASTQHQQNQQQYTQSHSLSYGSNFLSPPPQSSGNYPASKPLTMKAAHSTNSLSMTNALQQQQQQQLLLQQQQQQSSLSHQSRLKMTKSKSPTNPSTITNTSQSSGSQSSKYSLRAALQPPQSSQRANPHLEINQMKPTTPNQNNNNLSNNIPSYALPSSARVKTDYSLEKKSSYYGNNQDTLLSPGAYSSFSAYKSSSLLVQSQQGHYSNYLQQPASAQSEAAPFLSSTGNTNRQQLHHSQQQQQYPPPSQQQQLPTKPMKSKQISQLLKTEPSAGDISPANLTIFIHCKNHRIGPISLSAAGKNVEWLTKQLINEIIMYEQFQLPASEETNIPPNQQQAQSSSSLNSSSSLSQSSLFDTQNILHFQSYQHRNISLSYYLTLKIRPLDPLFHKSLILEPFYSEKLDYLSPSQQQISLMHFHFIKCVGMGGFSRVYLVQKKDTGKMYALKLIEKKFVQTNKKEVIVQNERNIMTIMQGHPFLLQLDYAFESKDYIAFAMEYCAGGEMFYHLRKIKQMTEDQARFYFIEICLGIDFLHERHIIYRDIKPENILLDIDGHIRIGDFGLSKPDMDENEFAYSFCGSPEYMAPEMLLKVGHSYPVDHYTLGALLYELVTGLPPFYSQITEEIYKSILSEELTFPDHTSLSNELKHLLRGLLTKHPLQRLGQTAGTKEILGHPWCRKLNLNDIVFKKIHPPIKIDVIGFNFDEEEFSKGETEFKAKLMTSYYVQSNEFTPMFPDFYYESPSVKEITAQFNKEQAAQKSQKQQQKLLKKQQQSSRKQLQQQQQQLQNTLPLKTTVKTGNSDQGSQCSQNGSQYGGSVRVSQSNIANPDHQILNPSFVEQSDKLSYQFSHENPLHPLQVLSQTPSQPGTNSQTMEFRTQQQPLWQSQTNTPYGSFLSPQTKSSSGMRVSTSTGTSYKQNQMNIAEKLPQDQKENTNKVTNIESFNQTAGQNSAKQLNLDNYAFINGYNNQNASSNINNNNGNSYLYNSMSAMQTTSSNNIKYKEQVQQQQQIQNHHASQGGISNVNYHGKNSKSVQMKQNQPQVLLSSQQQQQQQQQQQPYQHIKNSNSLNSAAKSSQPQSHIIQNNNYFLSNGAGTGSSSSSNPLYPANTNATVTTNSIITPNNNNNINTSTGNNIHNLLLNSDNSQINSNNLRNSTTKASKPVLTLQKKQLTMNSSVQHTQQSSQQQNQQPSSIGLRMRTEEKEKTLFEDYENMLFPQQPRQQLSQQQQADSSQSNQASLSQPSHSLSSSHQLKKLAAARSQFNLSSTTSTTNPSLNSYFSNMNGLKGSTDHKRIAATSNSMSSKQLMTKNSQDYQQSSMNNGNSNNNYYASSFNASTGGQQYQQHQQPQQLKQSTGFSSSAISQNALSPPPPRATVGNTNAYQQGQQHYQSIDSTNSLLLGNYGGYLSNRVSQNPSIPSAVSGRDSLSNQNHKNINSIANGSMKNTYHDVQRLTASVEVGGSGRLSTVA